MTGERDPARSGSDSRARSGTQKLARPRVPPVIAASAVVKAFGGLRALRGVSLAIEPGECHALVGENGAGKSTLGRVLAGLVQPDAGTLSIDGRPARFRAPADALRAGIAMVHQELAFCPDLTVAENLCLGRLPRRFGAFVDRAQMRKCARERLAEVGGAAIDVDWPMRRLSTAQEQLAQIAHALGTGARLVVFDEPTSALSEADAARLFERVRALKKRGVAVVWISHRLDEVFALCERVTVLRDGTIAATRRVAEVGKDDLVKWMIGRDPPRRRSAPATATAEVLLRAEEVASPGKFEPTSFEVRAGEILGLAGLVGAGRTELLEAVFGLDPRARGTVWIAGAEGALRPHRLSGRGRMRPREAIDEGLALVPEDRKRRGLVLGLGAAANIALPLLDRLRRFGPFLDRRRARAIAEAQFASLRVKLAGPDVPVRLLSGGNQQKVVLAKWLAREPRVLLVDEPTRGIDVGAKASIHELLLDLASRGAAIVLASSDLPELLQLSTRVLVLRQGRVVAELPREVATQENVLRAMAGV